MADVGKKSCDDAISRNAVLIALSRYYYGGEQDIDDDYVELDYGEQLKQLYDDIVNLPSVTPKPCPNIETIDSPERMDTIEGEIKELFERVENIERLIREEREERLEKLKAEAEYAKFCCALKM